LRKCPGKLSRFSIPSFSLKLEGMKRSYLVVLVIVVLAIVASLLWLKKNESEKSATDGTGAPSDVGGSSAPGGDGTAPGENPYGDAGTTGDGTGRPATGDAGAPSESETTSGDATSPSSGTGAPSDGAPSGERSARGGKTGGTGSRDGKSAADSAGSGVEHTDGISDGSAPGSWKSATGRARPGAGTGSTAAGGFNEKSKDQPSEETSGAVVGTGTGTGAKVPRGAGSAQPGFDSKSKSDGMATGSAGTGASAKAPKAPARPTGPVTAYGVKGPKVWFVSSDLRKLAGSAATLEVGTSEGAKSTVWLNRAGLKGGDGVRVANGTNATFVRDLAIGGSRHDAVAFCAPGARECSNAQPSQLKSGVDLNHPEHWLAGADKSGKSSKGGSSFTVLFVAARASAVPNALLEHQNGEANATKGPFLGWIGSDIVGSIHGSQGIVSIAAVAAPDAWTGKPVPRIYTLRFDRRKQELKLFALGEKGAEVKSIETKKGDGPDNDQYAALTIGSKSPGNGAATYVYEHLAFPRALPNSDLCSLHRKWNGTYGLNIPADALKPCDE
jgi:hypothetical protein